LKDIFLFTQLFFDVIILILFKAIA